MLRMTLESQEAIGLDMVRFHIQIERSPDGVVWTLVPEAPTEIDIAAQEIVYITRDGSLSTPEKAAALKKLIEQKVRATGLSEGEMAMADVDSLIPAWPVVINF